MSNFVYGRIVCNDLKQIIDSQIDFSITKYCVDHGFAVHFTDGTIINRSVNEITFQLSDNFLMYHCDRFLEPVVYTLDGKPRINSTVEDLKKVQGLVKTILENKYVEMIELRFSCAEVDEFEYDVCKTSCNDMVEAILSKYLSETDFPVIKVMICNTH